jgi:hypothetical protein
MNIGDPGESSIIANAIIDMNGSKIGKLEKQITRSRKRFQIR